MEKQGNKRGRTVKGSADLANAEVALRRAAYKVRETARKTGTSIVYSINGKIVKETPSNENYPEEKKHGH